MKHVDVAIIGGGIVGLATAYRFLERHPGTRLIVFEKERELASHQSGRNSGVLHSGIYSKPGTLRAANCLEGKLAMEAFCEKEGIAFSRCGKVIVACELIGPERLKELEPHAAGVRAVHVPEAGIVDYRRVCERLARRITEAGGTVTTGAKVTAMFRRGDRMVVEAAAGEFEARLVVNCGGLHSDRLTRMSGRRPGGPNAVLAFCREGYNKTSFSFFDTVESLTYPGFLRLARKHWRAGIREQWRSLYKRSFARTLQRLVPEVRDDDLVAAPAGVRAQALKRSGELVDDFLIVENDLVINVCNAPSPAATAALNVGRLIVDRVAPQLRRSGD